MFYLLCVNEAVDDSDNEDEKKSGSLCDCGCVVVSLCGCVTFPYRKVYILDNKLEFSGRKIAEF